MGINTQPSGATSLSQVINGPDASLDVEYRTDPLTGVSTISGDAAGAVAAIAGGIGINQGYTVDSRDTAGRWKTLTSNGIQYTATYTAAGTLQTVTGNGKTETYSYDAAGRLVSVIAS